MPESETAAAEDPAYVRLRDFVTHKSGLEFPPSRRPQLKAAIEASVRDLGLRDASQLLRLFRDQGAHTELEGFIASLTIGETYFFRNEPQFDALEQHVLPDLIERHSGSKKLRVWSAGCSTGEEPYSLAMLLDRLVPDLEQWDVMIVATDIDREALKTATTAIYRPWSLRRTSDEVRGRYFTEVVGGWQLHPRIRRMVDFRYLNLVDDLYPSLLTNIHALDLIVCRNVLIYFGTGSTHAVLARLAEALAEEGWLVLGHSEVVPSQLRELALRQFPGAVLYQKTKPLRRKGDESVSTPRSPASKGSDTRVQKRSAAAGQAIPPPRHALRRRAEDMIPELIRKSSDDARDPRPAYALAKLHADRGNVSEARRWIEEALAREPLFAPAHLVAALMAEEDGRLDAAISGFRRCIYADPTWPLPYVALGRCFTKQGDAERCRTTLTTVIRLLEDREPGEPVADGDGITAGRLLELAKIQKEISATSTQGEAEHGL